MNKYISILGSRGSGKTTYIVNLYNHYHKLMGSRTYQLRVENKEEKGSLDKMLRELKLKKYCPSSVSESVFQFSLLEKDTEKVLSELIISDVSLETLCEDPEVYEKTVRQSDVILFVIDSDRIAEEGSQKKEQLTQIKKFLQQDKSLQAKPKLFLFSKYDKFLELFPDMTFEEYREQYLTGFITSLKENNIKKWDMMPLSSFSEADEEVNLNEQLNLMESFEWVIRDGLNFKRLSQIRKACFISFPIIIVMLTIIIGLYMQKNRDLKVQATMEYERIQAAYERYEDENKYDKKKWETLYEELTAYKVRFQKVREDVGSLETKLLMKLEALEKKLLMVERGHFIMGSNDDKGVFGEYSKPVHKVEITYDFLIGRYEVTNEEYVAWLNDSNVSSDGVLEGKERINMMPEESFNIHYENGQFSVKGNAERKPVNKITWWGAVSYCNWLSEKEGLPVAYDDKGNLLDENGEITYRLNKVTGYRLPSEAEWEYAAQGGTESDGYLYSGSDVLDEVGWYASNNGSEAVVFFNVGEKQPNELGIYDMSGNVEEWCQDCMDLNFYEKSPVEDPVMLFGTHQQACFSRIIRGGASFSDESTCRVTSRYTWGVDESYTGLGFRIVRTIVE